MNLTQAWRKTRNFLAGKSTPQSALGQPKMEGSTTKAQTIDFLSSLEKEEAITFQSQPQHCSDILIKPPGDFPLSNHPSIALDMLATYILDPSDLARLEATCCFFKKPANFAPDNELSLAELTALEICKKWPIFKSMKMEERSGLKERCGSWKLVLKFLMAQEACPSRRGKSQVVAGYSHSIAVSSQGVAYAFGDNYMGQLGHGTHKRNEYCAKPISALQGIRIVQATARNGKTMLISDHGQVYAFGILSFGEVDSNIELIKKVNYPQLVDSLKDIFVVDVAIGDYFAAVLSRDGRVYTFNWGKQSKLDHQTNLVDSKPVLLGGELENIPVVQISAGSSYLLALAFLPSGLEVYMVGCGKGGKLGNGTTNSEPHATLVEDLLILNFKPITIAAGSWHIAVLGKDGRVCTWGWGNYGCLGHGNQNYQTNPKVVEALSRVKAVHIATGDYTTFVVTEDGVVYSFGCDYSYSLGHGRGYRRDQAVQHNEVLLPTIVKSLGQVEDRIVQISPTKASTWHNHTLLLTESGKLYGLGRFDNGQMGRKFPIPTTYNAESRPQLGIIDLN